MLFKISDELIELADLFNKNKKTLYIVGGYVRNKILGIADYENLDIDLCSSAKPSEIENILKNSEYKLTNKDNLFGVIKIIGKNGKVYEHATFRKEKYNVAGSHNPTNIEFINSLEEDSLRRDFRMNAIYYDIYRDEICDPLNGVQDIKNRVINTTREARLVFNDDSERILRLVRQSCILGFDINNEVLNSAKNNAFKLKYLQNNRIKKEFEKILLSDNVYRSINVKNSNVKGITLLAELGALEYILPMLQKIFTLKYIDDKNNYLFNHIVETLRLCSESSLELIYSILMHDYGKAESLLINHNFKDYIRLSNEIIEQELNNLGYNKEFVNDVKNIVEANNYNISLFKPSWKLRFFIINNYKNIDNIILLKKYICINKNNKLNLNIAKLLKQKNNIDKLYIKKISDLNINASDIIDRYPSLNKNFISEIIQKLFVFCIKNNKNNNRETLIKKLDIIINKNKYLEV